MKNKTYSVFVITLTQAHLHYCKALVASINYFHPSYKIIIIKDGNFNTTCFDKHKNIEILNTSQINNKHSFDLSGLLNN